MLNYEQLLELRKSYIEIGKIAQKYGNGQYNGELKKLMGQIKCIDSQEDDMIKQEYLVESYSTLFSQRGSLSDLVIYEKDKELRSKLNELYNREIEKVYGILKKYMQIN